MATLGKNPDQTYRFSVLLESTSKVAQAQRVVIFVNAKTYPEARKLAKSILKSPTRWKYHKP